MRLVADKPAVRQRPIATIVIAVLTSLVTLALWATGPEQSFADKLGFVPARLSGLVDWPGAVPALLTPLSATLAHGNAAHLGMNMLVLLFVGTQVERVLGKAPLVFAYVVGAYVSAMAQWVVEPGSINPMIGASGAISALFGIYALMFGRMKPITGRFAVDRTLHALWLLVSWVVLQWMTAALMSTSGMLLATPAHIGGFIGGLLMQRPLLLWRYRKA